MFGIESDSDVVDCPYNKAHRILRKRLQTHLIRCRKMHPDVELQKCPFNVSHLIPEPEYVNHVATCPDRKLITQYMFKAEERPKQEEIIRHEKIEDEENWDDTEAPDFKPKRFIEAANIKLERKPNIRALKRERSYTRSSRSRSPVFRPYEYDPATTSRNSKPPPMLPSMLPSMPPSMPPSKPQSKPPNDYNTIEMYDMDDDPYYGGKGSFD